MAPRITEQLPATAASTTSTATSVPTGINTVSCHSSCHSAGRSRAPWAWVRSSSWPRTQPKIDSPRSVDEQRGGLTAFPEPTDDEINAPGDPWPRWR